MELRYLREGECVNGAESIIIDLRWREEELKRIEDEKKKGNDYDTFL